MGCKCANSGEDEEEIEQKTKEETNLENKNNTDYNNNFNQKEDLLGLDNQNSLNQNDINNPNNLEDKYNENKDNNDNNENDIFNKGENNNENNNINYEPNPKYADYPEKIVEIRNKIREDPVGYADIIEDSIKYIIEEEDKKDPTITRLIFKKKVKVALNKGEPIFREAIDYLRTLTPLPPLEFNYEKCIPLPDNEEELKDPTFLREQVKQIREKTEIDVFFKDLIKVPEVSGLLMIVDDTNKNAGKKRLALLNKDLKYIGVTSKFIGKTFIAYFAFSK